MMQLNKREKLLLKILLSVVSVLVMFFFILKPLYDKKIETDEAYAKNQKNMNKLHDIYRQYREIKQKRTRYKALINNTEGVPTLIEKHAKDLNIWGNKSVMNVRQGNMKDNYKKITTHVKFVSTDITSILSLLHKMEHSNSLIRVSYLRINESLRGRDIYDVTIKFDSISSQ